LFQDGCVTHKLDDISIITKKGSVINLDEEQYQIKDSTGCLYIEGIGIIISDSTSNSKKEFRGSISYDDIEKIVLTERSMISFLFVTGVIILVFITIFSRPWN
jgi:hypothetical protein